MKLTLNEDIVNEVEEVLPVSTMINQLIKGEWDAVDLYNGMLASLSLEDGNKDVVEVIKDIVAEEYVHIGQLEKLLQNKNAAANEIEVGKEESEDMEVNG